jgi:hypothetical protein
MAILFILFCQMVIACISIALYIISPSRCKMVSLSSKVLRKITPNVDLPNTLGGGNYDLDQDGNYIFNYGAFWAKDTTAGRPVFEFGDGKKFYRSTLSHTP